MNNQMNTTTKTAPAMTFTVEASGTEILTWDTGEGFATSKGKKIPVQTFEQFTTLATKLAR